MRFGINKILHFLLQFVKWKTVQTIETNVFFKIGRPKQKQHRLP